jgi:hypothetical protein
MAENDDKQIDIEALLGEIRQGVLRRGGMLRREKLSSCASNPRLECGSSVRPDVNISLPRFADSVSFAVKPAYCLEDFFNQHDSAFVLGAYRGILRREPDGEGFNHYLTALRSGSLNKVEILGRIRYSHEGRLAGVRIRGLLLRFVSIRLLNLPLLGGFMAWIKTSLRLPVLFRTVYRLESVVFAQRSGLYDNINNLSEAVESRLRDAQVSLKESYIDKTDMLKKIEEQNRKLREQQRVITLMRKDLLKLKETAGRSPVRGRNGAGQYLPNNNGRRPLR